MFLTLSKGTVFCAAAMFFYVLCLCNSLAKETCPMKDRVQTELILSQMCLFLLDGWKLPRNGCWDIKKAPRIKGA